MSELWFCRNCEREQRVRSEKSISVCCSNPYMELVG